MCFCTKQKTAVFQKLLYYCMDVLISVLRESIIYFILKGGESWRLSTLMWTYEQMGVWVCASVPMRMVGESGRGGWGWRGVGSQEPWGDRCDFNNGSFCNFYMLITLRSLSLQCLFNIYTDSFPGFCFSLFDKVSLQMGLGFLSIIYLAHRHSANVLHQ